MQTTRLGINVLGRDIIKHYNNLLEAINESNKHPSEFMDAMEDVGYNITDAYASLATTASITTPLQFLQTFLPGVVRIFQYPLKIDDTIGFVQAGSWEDEQVVQRIVEWIGYAREYSDNDAKPLTNYNTNFDKRTIVRFEIGMNTSVLAEKRAAKIQINDVAEKQNAAALIIKQILNNVGYNGYNSGANLTYGILNDPNLPSYVAVAGTGSGNSTEWSAKTWANRQADLITMAKGLFTQTGGRVDPSMPGGTKCTLAIANNSWQYFQQTNDYGISLLDWFETAYPNTRIVPSPNFDLAYGGLNIMYWFADTVMDEISDDGGNTFAQIIPAKFMALGMQQMIGGYKTAYTCATAGVMCKRPIAVYRASSM